MRWVCGFCGFVDDGDEAPDTCPVCGAHKSKFSEMTLMIIMESMMNSNLRYWK